MCKIEWLCEDSMIINIGQQIGLELFFIGWIGFVFKLFFSCVDMLSEYIQGVNNGLNVVSQNDSVSFLL